MTEPRVQAAGAGPATQPHDHVIADLRAQVEQARTLAQTALRDTNRMVRLLTAVTEPAPTEQLVERVLEALSEAFTADVTAVGQLSGGHLLITHDCGLPEERTESADRQWPSRTALEALAHHRPVSVPLSGDGADVPPMVWRLGMRTAVWVPISYGRTRTDTIIVLCRSSTEPFTSAEQELLAFITSRLGIVVAARERSLATTRLAESSHRLAKHLDVQPMLEEAVALFRGLVNADGAVAVQIDNDVAAPAAIDGADRIGLDRSQPAHRLVGWPTLGLHQPYRSHTTQSGADAQPAAALLAVPVVHDDGVIAVLYAWRDAVRPFTADAENVALIFGNHLATSMANARLYRALSRNEAWLRLITDSISDMVSVVDSSGTCLYASPSFHRQLGYQPRPGESVFQLAPPEDLPRLRAWLGQPDRGGRTEHRLRHGAGDWVWVETVLHPAILTEFDGALVLSSRVINDRKRLEGELHHRAFHDPLTGLANRSMLDQRLARALAADRSGGVGLLFCDLDGFKAVNDRSGHQVGDELLLQVAARFAGCLRPDDTLARFGGDEFVFVLDDVDELADVLTVGQRVLRALEDPFTVRGERVTITASIGGVLGAPGFATPNDMLRDADAAMFTAKDRGRGRIEVFDEAASHRAVDRLGIRSDLPHALGRDELSVHYQPVFDLATGVVTGFEALLRWTHPERGMIPPDLFIPMAEETGAISAIGEWVLREATAQLATWQRRMPGRPLTMNVNLSPHQLRQPDLADRILDVIRQAGVAPGDVCLEVTENGFVRSDVTELARTLHTAGVQFALDDFGTSYSNLGHLRYFPVKAIKVDRSFVTGLTPENCELSIVRGITAMAAALGLDVVAEGIETPEQRAALVRLGCSHGQGYLLSRPVPAAAAARLLDEASPLPAA